VCSLCLRSDETTQHLMVNCEVTQFIWKEVCTQLNLCDIWKLQPLNENLKSWFLVYPRHRMVPFFVVWGLWQYKDNILFENSIKNDYGICIRILMAIKE
jgi:hypothetical protein